MTQATEEREVDQTHPFRQVPIEYVDTTERALEVFRSMVGKKCAMDTETEVGIQVVGYDEQGNAIREATPVIVNKKGEEKQAGPNPRTAQLAVISIAVQEDPAAGIAGITSYVLYTANMDWAAIVALLDELQLEVDGWNADYDDPVTALNLRKLHGQPMWKYRPVIKWRDAMLGESIMRLGREGHTWHAGLAPSARKYLGVELEGKGDIQLSYKAGVVPNEEQIRYAAWDAIATLELAKLIEARLAEAQLTDTYVRGYTSRRIWQQMTIVRFPFHKDPWLNYIQETAVKRKAEIEAELAELTPAEVQQDLFGGLHLEWKPNSNEDVARILNTYSAKEVMAYTAQWLDGNGEAPAVADNPELLESQDILDDEEELTETHGRLLGAGETTDKSALALMGGRLAELIAEHRKMSKMWQTYGPSHVKYVDEWGRMSAEYTQALTATNRASSRGVNGQNLAPASKAFIKPYNPFLVFIAADFSQAELRVMAQLWNEQTMIEAFAKGEDQHERSAADMFKVDMKALKAKEKAFDAASAARAMSEDELAAYRTEVDDETFQKALDARAMSEEDFEAFAKEAKAAKGRYKELRGKAKPIAFGLPYGMRGKLLATNMTVQGNRTTPDEANELIEAYLQAKPGIRAGLEARDGFIEQISKDVLDMGVYTKDGQCVRPPKYDFDFHATRQLLELHGKINKAKDKLKTEQKIKNPTAAQISEQLDSRGNLEAKMSERKGSPVTDEEVDAEIASRIEEIEWAMSYLAPVVLLSDGTPFGWESRTIMGDRRVFEVSADAWMTSMAMKAVRSRKPKPQAISQEWAVKNNVTLFVADPATGEAKLIGFGKLKKLFEDRFKRNSYVKHVLDKMSDPNDPNDTVAEYLSRLAVSDQVKGKGNQFRNHPIQGSVSSVVQLAMANWADRCWQVPSSRSIMSVHDSFVQECDIREARQTLTLLKDTMEEALMTFCPDVKCVADADVQLSLDDKSIVPLDELDAKIAELLATPAAKEAEAVEAEAHLAALVEGSAEYEAAKADAAAKRAEADQWAAWLAEADERRQTFAFTPPKTATEGLATAA